jgi:hypothetical protein
MHTGKVDWAGLEPDERREFLENLNEPPKLQLRVPKKATRAKAGRRKAAPGKAARGKATRRGAAR